MSRENVEIVRLLYSAMAAQDVAGATKLTHPDMEWVSDSRVGEGPIRGREDVTRWFMDQAETFDDRRLEPERFYAKDDKVLVFVHATGRGRASGAPFDIRIAHLWTVRNGLVTRGKGYGNRDEALEAVGLAEQDADADS